MSEGYIIEKGIPMPDLTSKKHVNVRSPDPMWSAFQSMEVGDSILTKKSLPAISFAAQKSGVNVTSRREGLAYRVWRVD